MIYEIKTYAKEFGGLILILLLVFGFLFVIIVVEPTFYGQNACKELCNESFTGRWDIADARYRCETKNAVSPRGGLAVDCKDSEGFDVVCWNSTKYCEDWK